MFLNELLLYLIQISHDILRQASWSLCSLDSIRITWMFFNLHWIFLVVFLFHRYYGVPILNIFKLVDLLIKIEERLIYMFSE
jgi:hypothetical protein